VWEDLLPPLLIDSAGPCPDLNHINEAAISYVFGRIKQEILVEVETAEDETSELNYGKYIIDAYNERFPEEDEEGEDEDDEFRTIRPTMSCRTDEVWEEAIDRLSREILWDEDFEIGYSPDLYRDLSKVSMKKYWIEEGYFASCHAEIAPRPDSYKNLNEVIRKLYPKPENLKELQSPSSLASHSTSIVGEVEVTLNKKHEKQRKPKQRADSLALSDTITNFTSSTNAKASIPRKKRTSAKAKKATDESDLMEATSSKIETQDDGEIMKCPAKKRRRTKPLKSIDSPLPGSQLMMQENAELREQCQNCGDIKLSEANKKLAAANKKILFLEEELESLQQASLVSLFKQLKKAAENLDE